MIVRCRCYVRQCYDASAMLVLSLLLVDGLHELPYHERYTLNTLDLFLCSHQLSLQTPLLIFDVLFLQMDVPATVSHLCSNVSECHILQLPLQLLEGRVVIVSLCGEALEGIKVRYR